MPVTVENGASAIQTLLTATQHRPLGSPQKGISGVPPRQTTLQMLPGPVVSILEYKVSFSGVDDYRNSMCLRKHK
jgi:hypothetical protein